MKNDKVIVDGKSYQKSLRFGNRDFSVVFINKKKYNRKEKFQKTWDF